MKYIPILYSTDMVQAKQDGRKSQTRRVIKPQPIIDHDSGNVFNGKHTIIFDIHNWKAPFIDAFSNMMPGDIFWTRETFFSGYLLDENENIPNDAPKIYVYFADTRDKRPADMSDEHCYHLWGNNKECWPKWKPNIHMPKSACRMWDEVVSIRVERLQDISEDDAIAEGIKIEKDGYSCFNYWTSDFRFITPEESFHTLWEPREGESWFNNPWVWVIEFKPIEKPENWPL